MRSGEDAGPKLSLRSVPFIEEPCLSGLPISFFSPNFLVGDSTWASKTWVGTGPSQNDGTFLNLYGRCLRHVKGPEPAC